ncbi:MAG: hypothetical protein WD749_06555 [Phycisphaerales bacterium]
MLPRLSLALPLAALLAGCTCAQNTAGPDSRSTPAPRAAAPATDAHRAALLDRIKQLEGEWEGKTPEGGAGRTVFAVSSNGSVVREIMLVGEPHEMTNVYHMDGPDLIMTHYCAIGNQPRLRAKAPKDGESIDLKFDSVTNLAAPDGMYMGRLTLTILDPDHLRQEWRSYHAGVEDPSHLAVFDLKRKK